MTRLRYDYPAIVARIKAVVEADDRPLKKILEELDISADQWSRKMQVNAQGTGGKKTSFTYDELTRVANHFNAPEGWPFMDWGRAEAVDRAIRAMEALAAAAPPGAASGGPNPPAAAGGGHNARRRHRAAK